MELMLCVWAVMGLKCQGLSGSALSAPLLGSLCCTGHPVLAPGAVL